MTSSEAQRPAPWFREWLPEILFLTVTTAAGLRAGGRWLDPVGDPGFSWSLAHRLAQGDVLYRDVYLAYGPLSPYLLAGVARLFGPSTLSLLLWNWIAAVAAGLLLLRCGRPFLSTLERIALAGVVLAFSLFVPGPGRLIFPYYAGTAHALALSLGALCLRGNAPTPERKRCWLAGLLAGLAFCSKQEIGAAALIALFVSLLPRPKDALSRGWRIASGFAGVVALGAVVALSSASLDSLRDRNHFWPLDLTPPAGLNRLFRVAAGMAGEGWPFALRESVWELLVLLVLLASAAMLAARERRLASWRPILLLAPALLIWWAVEAFRFSARVPVSLSAIIAFLVVLLALGKRNREERTQLAAIATFAGLVGLRTVFSYTVSGHFDGPAHLAASLTWILFLCVFAPGILAPSPRAAGIMRRLTGVFLLVVSWHTAISGADSLRLPGKHAVPTRRGMIYLEARHATFFWALSRELQPGEKALVIPEINAIDVLFGVQSVSPLLDILPGWLDLSLEREMIRRFQSEPPDVVVIFNRPLQEYGVARFGEGYGKALAEWISAHYQPVLSDRAGWVLRPTGARTEPRRSPAPGPLP